MDDGFQLHAQSLGIQFHRVAADDPLAFQQAQPAQAGGWREGDLLRQVLVAHPPVLLQVTKNAQIDGVQGHVQFLSE